MRGAGEHVLKDHFIPAQRIFTLLDAALASTDYKAPVGPLGRDRLEAGPAARGPSPTSRETTNGVI